MRVLKLRTMLRKRHSRGLPSTRHMLRIPAPRERWVFLTKRQNAKTVAFAFGKGSLNIRDTFRVHTQNGGSGGQVRTASLSLQCSKEGVDLDPLLAQLVEAVVTASTTGDGRAYSWDLSAENGSRSKWSTQSRSATSCPESDPYTACRPGRYLDGTAAESTSKAP